MVGTKQKVRLITLEVLKFLYFGVVISVGILVIYALLLGVKALELGVKALQKYLREQ